MKKKNKVFKIIVFSAAAIGLTYAVNQVIDIMATRNHLLGSDPEDFYQWKDSRVYYKKKGTGKPLLLLHDLSPISSAFEWEKVTDELAKNHTVYVMDLPGCGRSDKEKITYVGYYYVQLIQSFLADMVGTKADVAAAGNMAPILLSACISENSLIDRIVLVNPVSIESQTKSHPETCRISKKILELPILGTLIYNILNCRNQVDLAFTEKILYNPFHADSNTIDTCYEAAHLGNGGGRFLQASLTGGYLDVDPSHALKTIHNPISVIGGRSADSIDSVVQGYRNLIPEMKSVLIPNTKMLPQLEEPAAFVSEFEKLISD